MHFCFYILEHILSNLCSLLKLTIHILRFTTDLAVCAYYHLSLREPRTQVRTIKIMSKCSGRLPWTTWTSSVHGHCLDPCTVLSC